MNLGFFASFIGFALIIYFLIKQQKHLEQARNKSFWERERQANSTRRKSLDELDYISIPLEKLPTHLLQTDAQVQEYIEIISSLTGQRVVNLTGQTNTDLKLRYGTANITLLTEYDQNYIVLVRTLQQWADALMEAGYTEEAVPLLEFAISTGTDVSHTYYRLADYWLSKGETARVEQLIMLADRLQSANRKSILKNLRERLN